jgi:hypothetical protein
MITVKGGIEVSKLSIGRDTVTDIGVGEGPAEATPPRRNEAVIASVTLFQLV